MLSQNILTAVTISQMQSQIFRGKVVLPPANLYEKSFLDESPHNGRQVTGLHDPTFRMEFFESKWICLMAPGSAN